MRAEDRLEVHGELLHLEREAEVLAHVEAPTGLFAQTHIEHLDAVAAAGLGLVQRRVGGL